MARTPLNSPRQKALREFLRSKREAANLTQSELAKRMNTYQSFVADVERGERRIDVFQFWDFAEALRFDPGAAMRKLNATKR